MKIYLIRHGETTGDKEDRYGGNYDDHLTDLGKRQIKETAEKLVGKNIEIIFTSPLIRTKEATDIINSKTNCPVEVVSDFEERVITTFQYILTKGHNTIAVVSHGGPIKQILGHMGQPMPEKLGDGEIIELEI